MARAEATAALAATARFHLAALDLDVLRRLWTRRGGESREYTDGTIELLAPNGERIARGTPATITDQLRVRLARLDPLTLACA